MPRQACSMGAARPQGRRHVDVHGQCDSKQSLVDASSLGQIMHKSILAGPCCLSVHLHQDPVSLSSSASSRSAQRHGLAALAA